MKSILEVVITLLILVGVFFLGRFSAPDKTEFIITSDTVTVEKAVPKYIYKYFEKEGKIDTQYIAKLDTVIKDVTLSVAYESWRPIPLGAFSISAITPSFKYSSTDYYVQANIFTPRETSIGYRLSAGRYLINKPNLKLGLGGYYERRTEVGYGAEVNLRLEF